jgi:hypothetical protein
MAKPYDSALKFLLDTFPQDWLRLVGLPEESRRNLWSWTTRA